MPRKANKTKMTRMTAFHMKSQTHTSLGLARNSACLVISDGGHEEYDCSRNYYKEEAEQVFTFLSSVFCRKTLEALKGLI